MNLPNMIGPIEDANPVLLGSHVAILWGLNDLLAQALSSFLQQMEWSIFRIQDDGDIENFFREMMRLHPEVVFLRQDKADNSFLPWRLIDEKLCLKVITVCTESNVMQVYSKQDVLLQGASDLFSVIDQRHVSNDSTEKEVGLTT